MYRTYTKTLVQRALIAPALFIAVFALGCDPITRVEQSVVLRVSSVDGQSLLSSVSLSVREYHQPSADDEEFERFNPQRREQMYPWTQDVETDESSRATIVYGVTMVDRSRGNVPPSSRRPLEGHVFTVRIKGSDGEIDELNLEMSEGTTAEGRRHRIAVEKITKAIYVNPN